MNYRIRCWMKPLNNILETFLSEYGQYHITDHCYGYVKIELIDGGSLCTGVDSVWKKFYKCFKEDPNCAHTVKIEKVEHIDHGSGYWQGVSMKPNNDKI